MEGAPGAARLEWVQADALDMPFQREFELATCFGALGHILPRDEPRFVDQIARALRPNGRFLFVSSFMPSPFSLRYWLSRSFNAAMHVRNLLVAPPFVMFYLTFLLPAAQELLESRGFRVTLHQRFCGPRYADACLVEATLCE
jgi:SAM-dependent methyltransferase